MHALAATTVVERLDLPWEVLDGPVAIVDLETSGLSPDRDRIIEIAVLRLERGAPPRWLDSLVDPSGRVGPTWVHGIGQRDVRGAPTFAQLAPALQSLLEGAVLVAHNASFEARFLAGELQRIGGWWDGPRLCTVQLSRRLHPGRPSHSLGWLCAHYGVSNPIAHRAMSDVLATAEVLGCLLRGAEPGVARDACSRLVGGDEVVWPALPARNVAPRPRSPAMLEPANALRGAEPVRAAAHVEHSTPPGSWVTATPPNRRWSLLRALEDAELWSLVRRLGWSWHGRAHAIDAVSRYFDGDAAWLVESLSPATRDRLARALDLPPGGGTVGGLTAWLCRGQVGSFPSHADPDRATVLLAQLADDVLWQLVVGCGGRPGPRRDNERGFLLAFNGDWEWLVDALPAAERCRLAPRLGIDAADDPRAWGRWLCRRVD